MACVDENEVVDFIRGRLDAAAAATFEGHVDQCDECRVLLSELSRSFLAPPRTTGSGTRDLALAVPIDVGGRIGHYVILNWLGSGSMGVVYGAYDPHLDRKAALKLLRADVLSTSETADLQARLTAEAQAMAKVSHPNVIPIYETGSFDGHVFLAMEFVEGSSLLEWQTETDHPWRAILDVYVQAGRGLAAAHAANVVHRDFKPENVMLGRDGRARVTDFGLARQTTVSSLDGDLGDVASAPSPPGVLSSVAGTPAYMAPEQRSGIATHRSDQFSFCVALHEALFGEHPFEPLRELRNSDRRGIASPKGTSAPNWVRTAIERGLNADPEKRHASMDALLACLSADPVQRVRRIGALAVAILLVGALGVGFLRWDRTTKVCAGAESQLSGIWDTTSKEAIHRAFRATGRPYAEDAWRGVSRILDEYTKSWVATRTDACEATQIRKKQSAELLDRRMACLDTRLVELRKLSSLLSLADADTVENGVRLSGAVQKLDACSDAKALLSVVPPPSSDVRAHIEELHTRIAEARMLERAGKYAESYESVKPLVEKVRQFGYRPLEAEMLLLLGLLEIDLGRTEPSLDSLYGAIAAAERGHDDRTRALAWIELVPVLGYDQMKYGEAERAIQFAEAAIERAGDGPELRANLENSVGSVSFRKGKYEEALSHMEKALSLQTTYLDPLDIALGETFYRISILKRHLGRRLESLDANQRAHEIFEGTLGPQHPKAALILNERAVSLIGLRRPAESLEFAQRALQIWDQESLRVPRLLVAGETNVAIALDRLGRFEEALPHLERALELAEKAHGAVHPETAIVIAFLARTERHLGHHREALALDTRALDMWEPKTGPPHPNRSAALQGIGESYLGLGLPARAIAPLERALAIEASGAELFDYADMRFALARARWDANQDRRRAIEMATVARDVFRTNPLYAEEATRVQSWLTEKGI